MQHYVAFASEAKQRHIPTLEMLKHFVPSAQVDKSSGNQIICSLIRKGKVIWVICKNLVAMSRASM
jgi:hypothetical protein